MVGNAIRLEFARSIDYEQMSVWRLSFNLSLSSEIVLTDTELDNFFNSFGLRVQLRIVRIARIFYPKQAQAQTTLKMHGKHGPLMQ